MPDNSSKEIELLFKMSLDTFQTDNEHCMLLALPCGRNEVDVLQQSKNLQTGFIMYLQQKQAAGIVNIAAPGSQQVRRNDYRTLS